MKTDTSKHKNCINTMKGSVRNTHSDPCFNSRFLHMQDGEAPVTQTVGNIFEFEPFLSKHTRPHARALNHSNVTDSHLSSEALKINVSLKFCVITEATMKKITKPSPKTLVSCVECK